MAATLGFPLRMDGERRCMRGLMSVRLNALKELLGGGREVLKLLNGLHLLHGRQFHAARHTPWQQRTS